jgi:hypothetical protein
VCWKKKYQERVVKFGTERPAVVWKVCHHNTRSEQAKMQLKYSRKLMTYSERHSRIVKHRFITAVLGHTIPHTSVATATVIKDFEFKYKFQHPPYSLDFRFYAT